VNNDHLVLSGNLESNKINVNLSVLIDIDATDYAFIDDSFAQRHSLLCFPLSEICTLQKFDDQPVVFDPITHYALAKLRVSSGELEETPFYVTQLSQFSVVLGLPWLKSHKAIIDLRHNQLTFEPQANSELVPETLSSTSIPAVSVPAPPTSSPPKHLEVYAIDSAPFLRLARKKNHDLFAIFMRDIDKALKITPSVDSATLLPPEYHDFLDVFSRELTDTLPERRPYDHKIQLQEGKTSTFEPLYDMSQDELRVLKKYLENNLAKDFIQASSSPAASSILFVKKPSGGLRFCVNYRDLNVMTVKNRYPLPLIRETLDRLTKTKYYIKLDIIAAFNKLRMAYEDEWKTAFRTRYDLYEYNVLPFGLTNGSSSFQNFINDTLHDFLNVFCTAYMNDILIYSNSKKKHTQHVRQILKRLRAVGLQVDIEKCEFSVIEIKYLSLIITTHGIKINSEKVNAVMNWTAPRGVKDVQSFLSFANFYRRFIKKFSKLAGSLTALTRKDQPFNWTQECQFAFDRLKQTFTTAPILMHYNPDLSVTVKIDASDYVVIEVMSQRDDNEQLRPVTYFSSKMLPAECNYEIYDKELLAIIRAFEEWRPELKGTLDLVEVISDHKNLEYFMSIKLLSRRQARWSEFLSRFNFKIVYRSSELNTRADALTRRSGDLPLNEKNSRREHQWQTVLKPKNLEIQVLTNVLDDSDSEASESSDSKGESVISEQSEPSEEMSMNELEEQLSAAYFNDEWVQTVVTALRDGQRKLKEFPLAKCTLRSDRVYYRDRLLVPEDEKLQLRLLQLSHDTPIASHSGRAKTYEILSRHYYWSGMIKTVARFVRNCHLCSRVKISREKYQGALKPLDVPNRRWKDIAMNFIVTVPESKDLNENSTINILIVVNRLSKQVHYEPMSGITVLDTARVFYRAIWKHHGLPDSIVSNRETQFVSHFWDELCTRLKIQARLSTAFHSETNDQTENVNGVLEQYLRAFVSFMQDDWAAWLPSAEFATNNHFSESTQCTPFLANFEQHPRMRLEPKKAQENVIEHPERIHADLFVQKMNRINEILREQMTLAQAYQEQFANVHRQHAPKYAINDMVWLDARNLMIHRPSKKLSNKFEESFRIIKIVSSHSYQLELLDDWFCFDVFHTYLLHPAANDPLPEQIPPAPFPIVSVEEVLSWEMNEILNSRVKNSQLEYLIKWTGIEENSWVKFADVMNVTEAMDAYHARNPDRPSKNSWIAYVQGSSDSEYESED